MGLAVNSDSWQEQSAGSLLGHDLEIFKSVLSSTGLSIFTGHTATIANCHWQCGQLHKALTFTYNFIINYNKYTKIEILCNNWRHLAEQYNTENMKALKSALRKEMSNIISNINSEEKARQSLRVFEKLKELPQYQNSKRISLYLSTADEIDTLPILKNIFETGKEAFVPRYAGKNMEMVKLLSMDDYEKLPLTKWNIKQPDTSENRENALENGGLDLILLPGVAFTKSGKRLGHGMGYYDRFLENCFQKQQKKPYLIAIAFNEQVKDDIPTTEKDVMLDMILTDK
ncbi:hypothetical protein KPH14_006700 [Odynerus spinipes]|uniref:5-formyltetrahydrofolate cyclo-ligase n=1 Tax=Odynerus spinipes TaxID=1348599 RepID=A0AAD9RR03_9HYME|nr:hypothetical protein KPH14_006700 [Odynerus spinipes]